MDVVAALEARTYQADLTTVIEVGDEFRSDGGRFALEIRNGRARCVRTDAQAEVAMDLDVLGSLYLGVHSAATLAAANRIRGADQESMARLDAAFRTDVPAQLGFHF
jgi:predicted acetyltransferase